MVSDALLVRGHLAVDVTDGMVQRDKASIDVRPEDPLVIICRGMVVVEKEVLDAGAEMVLDPFCEVAVLLRQRSASQFECTWVVKRAWCRAQGATSSRNTAPMLR